MRIISGEWRGRPLKAPAGKDTRPTSDRTREALFSILASRLGDFEGLKVADLFAGTGALGLEALSRGAAHCTFVENDRAALAALEANIASLKATERALVRSQSAALISGGPFHLVLMDPPYGKGLGQAALDNLVKKGSLAPGALISLETGAGEEISAPSLTLEAERKYGKARLLLFRAG